MRESISYGMIPWACDNVNDIILNVGSRNFLTNVSSNGYYGYQPPHHVQNKHFTNETDSNATKCSNINTPMEIQHQFNSCEEKEKCDMQLGSDIQVCRKRRCCYDEVVEFKKRRQDKDFSEIMSFNNGK